MTFWYVLKDINNNIFSKISHKWGLKKVECTMIYTYFVEAKRLFPS